ncbi:phenylalanine--tRNA ligase subunit beta [Engelhardtia mirabilis]|uniref:Phenylalanine--tRNA ligase beta subunit n=1 Tax=Engelhardtia mirabilis TaxID=2528011 RepID=A0A518BK67_9BACT|nr:Phenylalanine--tRNA ligase beta subunit [Planctomycetes bacterium Pla133]QDV01684.1 Phenylalanine--tRNA ligase beta subunit [Planctomycetes bacterium Pla86]
MQVSYRWLERHVDLSGVTPLEVARLLTLHVAEVEGVEPFAAHLSDVTVGHVLERTAHPDADKLSVCRVDVGQGEPLQIVCGAPNVAAGQRVAVATIGTVLPGDFKIKKGKIRGQESAGMICSVRELDLGDEHDGIWVLPGEPEVGRSVAQALGLADWVFEIDNKSVTHRPDLWGHRGMARELAALLGRELKSLDTSLPETGSGEPYPVRVETPGCPRYLALPIDGVRAEPSPQWLRLLLLAVGQRPIDLLVDVSNFVMLDLGQPNHLFDRRRLAGSIEVREAREGELIQTLDGEERRLTPADLLICSGDQPVALAGVMGGELSKVEGDTNELLLEIANFHGTTVRRTAARLALRTDASARFEKSLDPCLALEAAGHLVRILAQIQPSLTLPSPITDAGDWAVPSVRIALPGERVRGILGVDMRDEQIAAHLGALGFGVAIDGGVLTVDVPTWRATKDVTIAEDLIEEVGRTVGYDAIPGAKLVAEVAPPPRDHRRELVRALQDRLSGSARFHEALGYSFQSNDLLRATRGADAAYVEVINPVAEGESKVRRSVLPSLLQKLGPNLRQRGDVRLFEIGKGYLPERRGERGDPAEVHELGLALAAPRPAANARFDAGALPRLRGVLDDLLHVVGAPAPEWRRAAADLPGWAHPGKAVEAVTTGAGGGARVALLAAIHPEVTRDLEIDGDASGACVSLDAILALDRTVSDYRPVPRFPGVKLDVAFSVPAQTPAADVAKVVDHAGKGLVASVELFDVYAGASVGEGKKSLAYHVVLQAADRTLDDKDQRKYLDRLERTAAHQGLELRRE